MSQILLIEPDFILAKTFGDYLMAGGHKLVAASSAQAAILAADKTTPDIVILEIQLIEHSGIEFLYEFRSYKEWQNIPVIIYTHIPSSEFSNNWDLLKTELGVVKYLYKPQSSLKQLANSINQFSPQAV